MRHLNKPYKMLAFLMSALLLVNTYGLVINVHYCQTQLRSFSLLGKAKNCQQMTTSSHCASKQEKPLPATCENEEKGCCSNKTLLIKAELEDGIIQKSLIEENVATAILVPFFEEEVEERLATHPISYTHYMPPLLFKDIPILVQTFLL